MSRKSIPSFIVELPLEISNEEERTLLVRLATARQVYNACLGEILKRLRRMRESKQYQRARILKKGKGPVGLDLGPSTIAVVCETNVRLIPFAEEVEDYQPKIRRLQRKLDRQRRANNPDNYNDDGTVKKGARMW